MKLRIIMTMEISVDNLTDYDASTIEEAAINQQNWFADGSADPMDFVASEAIQIKVEPIK